MASPKTPDNLQIEPRSLHFDSRFGPSRWWLAGNPAATAIFNALSATFPDGERKFIESVVHYKDAVEEPLKGQIKAFVRQEANHTREHLAFNAHVAEAGYDMSRIEARIRKNIDFARSRPPVVQLASTAALEHFTAILAHQLLSNPRHIAGAPAEIARLWRWHSVEEIEHKAVAYDTLMAVTRNLSPFRRYRMRVLIMLFVTIQFGRSLAANVADLLRQDGFEPKRMRGAALRYLFGTPGILRRALPHYLAYYLPGFHPWDCRDEHLTKDVDLGASMPAAA